jgi:diguanylate cyclase (GGDEF)-like protein
MRLNTEYQARDANQENALASENLPHTNSAKPQDPSTLRLFICGGAILITLIVAGVVGMAYDSRNGTLVNHGRELSNTALLLGKQIETELNELDIAQQRIINLITDLRADHAANRHILAGAEIQKFLDSQADALPYVSGIDILTPAGVEINSSVPQPIVEVPLAVAATNAANKNLEAKTFTDGSTEISPNGRRRYIRTREILGSDGTVVAIVAGRIDLTALETMFSSVNLGPDTAIALFADNGALLARYPRVDPKSGRVSLFQSATRSATLQVRRAVSPFDGQEKLLVVRKLGLYPISIAVTENVNAALAAWREQTKALAVMALFAAVLVAGIVYAAIQYSLQTFQTAHDEVKTGRQQLKIAVDNMTQGLLLFDQNQNIIVCNNRYIAMYGVAPEVVRAGLSFRELVLHRKATGSFAGDVDEFCDIVLKKVAAGQASESTVVTADGRSILIVNRPLESGGWVATHEDVTDRLRSEERIVHLAHHDVLTDLANRASFHERFEQSVSTAKRDGLGIAMLCIDLDHFKHVNDTLGHAAGDEILKGVADRLRSCVRKNELVARLGGDEFAIALIAADAPAAAAIVADRVLAALSAPHMVAGKHLVVEGTIGIALFPSDGTTIGQLLSHADIALYGAKSDGRGKFRFFEPQMNARQSETRALELDLAQALELNQLSLNYQPIVDVETGRITSCEALLRWDHPVRGRVSPAEFIPAAEATGLITPIGEWVLREACNEAAKWPRDAKVAVNISALQFKSPNLQFAVIAALANSGLTPSRLELEITESVLLAKSEQTMEALQRFHNMGIYIALDDFGTGYSSLSYLRSFPFRKLKIDRCFVTDLSETNTGAIGIFKMMAQLGKCLDMSVTAEGIETIEQLRIARAQGCSEIQGYLLSRPVSASAVRELIASDDLMAQHDTRFARAS